MFYGYGNVMKSAIMFFCVEYDSACPNNRIVALLLPLMRDYYLSVVAVPTTLTTLF